MESAPRPFLDRDHPPAERPLHVALGKTAPHWKRLHGQLAERFGPLTEQWSWSGKAYGWSLKLQHEKRTVVYLIPHQGWFVASLPLSEAACAAARTSGLAKPLLEIIAAAPKFPEGRAVRLEVRGARDLPAVTTFAALRMSH